MLRALAMSILTIISLIAVGYKRYIEPQRRKEQQASKAADIGQPTNLITDQINQYEATQDISSLVGLLAHQDYDVREQASLALGRLGEGAIGALGQVLSDGALDARQMATRALASIPHQDVLPHLLNALNDGSFWVRLPAMDGLASFLGDQEVIQHLKDLRNNDTHPDVRQKADELLNRVPANR